MYKISNDIYNSINSTVNVKEVSCDMCNQILEKIIELYVDNEKKDCGYGRSLSIMKHYQIAKGGHIFKIMCLMKAVSCFLINLTKKRCLL